MPHALESYDASLPPADIVTVMGAGETHEKSVDVEMPIMQQQKLVGSLVYAEKDAAGATKDEQMDKDGVGGVEDTSRPSSAPESGAATPTLRISPCPLRLRPLIPPPNYGATKNGNVFRSAFPQDRNLDFLRMLGIKTVLCLVATEPTEAYSDWLGNRIKRHRVDIAPNKDGNVKTTWDSLCEALLIVMDSANHPLYIHCNQGRHRTGCVIACLRKVQRWPIEDIIAEYQAYAYPKARPGDIALIRAFDPEAVFDYLKRCGKLEDQALVKRLDSAIDGIDGLADAMSDRSYSESSAASLSSNASTISDEPTEMGMPQIVDNASLSVAISSQPALQRSQSQQGLAALDNANGSSNAVHAQAVVISKDSQAMDWSGGNDADATNVVELADGALTPPAEPCRKMLGAE